MSWQDRAKKLLGTKELKEAMEKLQTANGDGGKKEELPEIKLASSLLRDVEDLMMEGDLLEVSLDEGQHLWRILQATEPRRSKAYPDLMELEAELESVREDKMKARKKRKLENGGGAAGEAADTANSTGTSKVRIICLKHLSRKVRFRFLAKAVKTHFLGN